MNGTFQATARFQCSDIFHKTIEMALNCILSVNSHLSGFKLITWSRPCYQQHYLWESSTDCFLFITTWCLLFKPMWDPLSRFAKGEEIVDYWERLNIPNGADILEVTVFPSFFFLFFFFSE